MIAATTSVPVLTHVAFGIVAAMMVFSAIRVVTTKNVVHAALYLVLVLSGVGINYLLLQAEFVAITQILVYVGAIVVLLLFGVMLTKAELGVSEDLDNTKARGIGVLVSGLLLAVMLFAVIGTFKDAKVPLGTLAGRDSHAISDSIFGEYLLPFEAVSVLLLAALIGAIVLARKD